MLGRNYLSAEGGKLMGDALGENAHLRTVDMSYNNIGNEGGIALGTALRKNRTMVSLYLSTRAECYLTVGDNGIGPEGGAQIGLALHENPTLRSLNLSTTI